MNPKFLSNKFSIESHDIVILHGKVYEFYKDGSGKLIRSQDIMDVAVKENNGQGNRGRSSASKNCNKIFEINASQAIKKLFVTAEEKINSDIEEIKYLKIRLKILLAELDNKYAFLRKQKAEITGMSIDRDLHDNNRKEMTSSLSDDLTSVSMPILSPQYQRLNFDNSLEKVNCISAKTKLPNGNNCKASRKNLKNKQSTNHSSTSSDISMPTLSPYYKTPTVCLSDEKYVQKDVEKDIKILTKTMPNFTSVFPPSLHPVVSIVRLNKSVLAKYSRNVLPDKTSKRKLVEGYPAAKRGKKASSTINSSSEFINSPNKKSIIANNDSKAKNIKLKTSVKNSVLSKNKKSNLKNSKSLNRKPKKKEERLKKSIKTPSANKKSTIKPGKKLIMSSSLWVNRDSDSSNSSPETKKSSLAESDSSFSSEKICKTTILNTTSSKVNKSTNSVNKSPCSSSGMDALEISHSDEGENDGTSQSQNNVTPSTIKSIATEFLTPNQSPSDAESNYFTPPKNNSILNDA